MSAQYDVPAKMPMQLQVASTEIQFPCPRESLLSLGLRNITWSRLRILERIQTSCNRFRGRTIKMIGRLKTLNRDWKNWESLPLRAETLKGKLIVLFKYLEESHTEETFFVISDCGIQNDAFKLQKGRFPVNVRKNFSLELFGRGTNYI